MTFISLSLLSLFGSLAFAQEAETKTLKEVVVSASGFEQEMKEAPASIQIINREELEKRRFNSLPEVLGEVEGLDVGAAAGKTGGLNISIRGMPSDYTLILIDGRRQNNAGNITPNGFGETQTNFIPPLSAIERIEIIRGPMSTLYGSDAMGGIINIITKKVGDVWSGSLTVDKTIQEMPQFGNTSNASIFASGPLVKDLLGLAIRGSVFDRSSSNITYRDAVGETVSPRMGRNPVSNTNDTVGGRLTLTPTEDHDISLDFDKIRQSYDNSSAQLGTLGTGGYLPRQRYNREQTALAHSGRFGFGVLDSSVMQSKTETLGRTIPPGTPGKTPGSDRTLRMKSLVIDTKLVSIIPGGALGDHVLSVGGQYQDGEMEDGVAADSFSYEQWAVFVENEWRILDNLALTLGLRHDDHSTFGDHNSPRGYLSWSATPQWTFKGGVSQGYKTPRLDQLAEGIVGFGGQGTIPLLGSPHLQPETSTSTEIAALFDNEAGYSFNLTLFNNEFTDKIASGPGLANCSWATQPARPGCVDYGTWPRVDLFGQSVNIDKAITRGVEVGARVPLGAVVALKTSYTYTESEQRSGAQKGQPLTDTPKNIVNAKLDWNMSERFTSWLRGEYRSSRYRGAGAAQDALGDYKAYELFHLGSSFAVNKDVSINAALYNVLNKDFSDYSEYVSSPAAGTIAYGARYANPYEGRRLWISSTVNF